MTTEQRLADILDNDFIFIRRRVAHAIGDLAAAVFVSQLYHWQMLSADGWVATTHTEWFDRTALTRKQITRIRKALIDDGLLEHVVRGSPPTSHDRLNLDALLGRIQLLPTGTLQSTQREHCNVTDGHITPLRDSGETYTPGAPTHEGTAFEVPEWLAILREAEPYKVSQAQEAKMILNVAKHSITAERAEDVARDLAGQWPYKKHKRIDSTFINWAKGNRNGRGNAGDRLGDVQQRRRPPAKRELVTARRPGRDG